MTTTIGAVVHRFRRRMYTVETRVMGVGILAAVADTRWMNIRQMDVREVVYL